MKTRCNSFAPAGFTFIDLVTIIAVVVLLILLQVTTAASGTQQSKVVQCATNLRQIAGGMHIAAAENNDRMPSAGGVGFWAWDVSWPLGAQFEQYGVPWQSFYCPGTSPRFSNEHNRQLFTWTGGSPNGYRVLGYVLTLPDTFGVASSNWNPTLTPPLGQIAFVTFTRDLASQRVLCADATISQTGQNNPALVNTYNFVSITGGFPTSHGSPHLNGRIPAGGNLGMLDGSVAWRQFSLMVPRSVDGGGSPVFWW